MTSGECDGGAGLARVDEHVAKLHACEGVNVVHRCVHHDHAHVDDARHEYGGGHALTVHGHVRVHGALIGAAMRQRP